MGLELLRDSIASHDHDKSELDRAVVEEVSVSCDTAVEVLNELLIFEKLESSTLMLKLKQYAPHAYIMEILKPFHAQVRYDRVN